MKKAVLILIIMLCLYTDLCAFGDVYVARLSLPTLGANVATTTDYCSSQSWNTLTPCNVSRASLLCMIYPTLYGTDHNGLKVKCLYCATKS